MIDTVVTLATNYGREQVENTIGTISSIEAQAALRLHNGDIWAAVTECIRQRQTKVSGIETPYSKLSRYEYVDTFFDNCIRKVLVSTFLLAVISFEYQSTDIFLVYSLQIINLTQITLQIHTYSRLRDVNSSVWNMRS